MYIFTIGTRDYSSTLPLQEALTFNPEYNYCFDLQDTACLQLEGARAFNLLQGQLTCDIREISPTQMRTGGLCNLKGRLLALLDIIQDQDHWDLILPADLIEPTQTSLAPFLMVSHCKLKPVAFHAFGLLIQNSNALPDQLSVPDDIQGVTISQDLIVYRIAAQLAIVLVKHIDNVQPLLEPFKANNTLRETLSWHYLKIKTRHIELYPTTRGLFLPHRLDLHQTNILSFDKGCYKGQEIIARIQYKSTIKHTLRFFEYMTDETPEPGTTLHDQTTGEAIGELIDITPTPQTGVFWVAATTIITTHSIPQLLINSHQI